MHKGLLAAGATVVATWWVIFTLAAIVRHDGYSPFFAAAAQTLAVAVVGIAAGIFCVMLWITIDRRERRVALVAHDLRGLVSSIGPVPMLLQPPPEAPNLPRFQAPDVPDDFYVRWLAHFDRTHPLHTALMRRMMRIMQHHRHLPASPVPGGHGDRSLLQHSLLCGYLMHDLARNFKYEGARSKNTSRLILPLADPNYTFNAADPLCVIIGIAHDFGKIESYRYGEGGKVIGIGDEHDLTGARMVARLEECWALPDKDRFALMMALAHYHHPQELPLSPDRKAIDDRTIALMELLMLADVQASAIENTGRRMTSEELAVRAAEGPQETPYEPAQLLTSFLNLMHRTELINSQDAAGCIGWFAMTHGSNRPLLLVNEGNMARAIGADLEVDHAAELPDRRRRLTVALLGELARRGYLITKAKLASGEIAAYNPESALWKAKFNQRKADHQEQFHFGPVIVYLIDPALVPDLISKIKPRAGSAVLVSGVFGESRQLGARAQQDSTASAAPAAASVATPAASSPTDPSTSAASTASTPATDTAAGRAEPRTRTFGEPSQQPETKQGPPWDSGEDQQTDQAHAYETQEDQRRDRGPRREPAQDIGDADDYCVGIDPDRARDPSPQVRQAPEGKETRKRVPTRGGRVPGPAKPAAAPAPPAAAPVPDTVGDSAESDSGILSGEELMNGVIATINGLSTSAAQYVSRHDGRCVMTLPFSVLAHHYPSISWDAKRGSILRAATRDELPLRISWQKSIQEYAIECDIPETNFETEDSSSD